MYIEEEPRPSARTIVVLLTVLAAASFFFDLQDLWNGTIDPNKHIPFLIPLVLGFFVVVTVVVDRASRRAPEECAKFMDELHKNSFTHPDNLPLEKTKPGRIE